MLSPDLIALYTRVGLLFAIGCSVGLLLLGLGWLGVWLWGRARQTAARGPHQTLLMHLQQLEFVCGQEFPQVGDTAAYVRRWVSGRGSLDALDRTGRQALLAFREELRQKYGPHERPGSDATPG